jgi:DNA-binding transcriptional LysR family regulator
VLNQAGRSNALVFTASDFECLIAAVTSGLGVMAMLRSRAASTELPFSQEGVLPRLPALSCGIYLREGGEREVLEQLADRLAEHFHPRHDNADGDRGQVGARSVAPVRAAGR